jgi:hypothetical protein
MPNWFATVVLILWPLVALWLYLKRPFSQATIWTILGAQCLLPVGAFIKFSMIPTFDKDSIPNLCILAGCIAARRPVQIFRRIGITEIFMLMYLVGPILTSQNNGDPIVLGDVILPGVGLYDALSNLEFSLIILIPFVVGRQILARSDGNLEIFRALAIAGVFYSVPMLFEIRFSPQLHNWVYGYFPSEFLQSVRDGGYRPAVFMGHGLIVAMFAMMAAISAVTLSRLRDPILGFSPGRIAIYLSIMLILCKSLGATLYGGILAPLVRYATPQFQTLVALVIVSFSLLYPMLRSFNIVPTDMMVQAAQQVSDDRASSLKFRFINEDLLLERAFERPAFGWGRYGRNRVYSEEGKELSVPDGRWVITIGQFGVFGFIAEFGLLTIGVFRAFAAIAFAKLRSDKILLSALSLIVATNILDLLPNSSLLPWTWLLAGTLLGRAENLSALELRRSTVSRQERTAQRRSGTAFS